MVSGLAGFGYVESYLPVNNGQCLNLSDQVLYGIEPSLHCGC